MKIRVTLKDPDAMHDAVIDACHAQTTALDGLSAHEQRSLAAERSGNVQHAITSRWMADGEYLTVEFDTETWTATVLPATERR